MENAMLGKSALIRAPLVWAGGQLMRLGEKTVTPIGKAMGAIGRAGFRRGGALRKGTGPLRRGGSALVTAGKVAKRRYSPLAISSARAAAPKPGEGTELIAGRIKEILQARRTARLVAGGALGALGVPAAAIGLQKKEGAMITKDVAKELGCLVGEEAVKQARGVGCPTYGMKPTKKRNKDRGKTVTKIAAEKGMEKKSIGLGTGLLLASLAPQMLGGLKGAWRGLGRGLGGWLGLRRPGGGAGAGGYSGGAGGGAGGGGPLWGGHERAMFARMGFNPASYQQRERAMGDVAGGLGMQRRHAQAWQRMSRMPVF